MKTPNPEKNDETLCFVSIVFPITDDQQIIAVKQKIETAVEDLPKVKTEFRFTSVRNNGPIDS